MSSTEPLLAHIVYFSLKENSPAAVQKQVDAAQKYLTDHSGVVFLASALARWV